MGKKKRTIFYITARKGFLLLLLFLVRGNEPRAFSTLDKCPATEYTLIPLFFNALSKDLPSPTEN
jgi:hypothetical protein